MIELSFVRDLVAIFGVITGLTYYILTVRNTRKARETQIYLSIYSQFREKGFLIQWADIMHNWEWKDWEDWMEKYGPTTNPDAYATFTSVGSLFYTLGFLQKMKQF